MPGTVWATRQIRKKDLKTHWSDKCGPPLREQRGMALGLSHSRKSSQRRWLES